VRIVFLRSTTNAVGEYRVRHPMLALQAMGHECRMLTLSDQPERVANAELIGDVLVMQRQTSETVFALLDSLPADRRPTTVYEVDDNPWEWHSWDPYHQLNGYEYGQKVRQVMSRCDAITCSTPTLAARVRREVPGKPIWVVPNAIDYQLRDWAAKEDRREHGLEGKVVLGWTGSAHHERDGGVMLGALPAVFEEYPETVFLMQCDRAIYYRWTAPLHRAYRDRLRWVPPIAFAEHPQIYSLFDVNLAPLETTPFNICKSDLRLIEGGAHGVPYVASRLAPYAGFHWQSDGIGGYLASTLREWFLGIEQAIEEREARGQSLQRYVRETRALSVVAGQWEMALRGAREHREGEEIKAVSQPGRNDRCPCGTGRKYKQCCLPAYG